MKRITGRTEWQMVRRNQFIHSGKKAQRKMVQSRFGIQKREQNGSQSQADGDSLQVQSKRFVPARLPLPRGTRKAQACRADGRRILDGMAGGLQIQSFRAHLQRLHGNGRIENRPLFQRARLVFKGDHGRRNQ